LLLGLEFIEEKGIEPVALDIVKGEYYLLTLHRQENTEDIKYVTSVLSAVSDLRLPTVFPVHPRTKNLMAENNLIRNLHGNNLKLIDPVSYLEMLSLIRNASIVLTDSGGVQKEAYFSRVPCLTLRNETEWVETVETGWNRLVGINKNKILNGVKAMNNRNRSSYPSLFGNGRASEKIVSIISRVKN
jgi:UDP-N-acetylglucosamine 2-epimerase